MYIFFSFFKRRFSWGECNEATLKIILHPVSFSSRDYVLHSSFVDLHGETSCLTRNEELELKGSEKKVKS
jgi:hypothetical protein